MYAYYIPVVIPVELVKPVLLEELATTYIHVYVCSLAYVQVHIYNYIHTCIYVAIPVEPGSSVV